MVNEESIFFLRGAKLLAHNWSSCHQATTHSIKKLFFCNNGVSFQDSLRGKYRRIKVPMKWKIEVLKNKRIWKAFKSEEEHLAFSYLSYLISFQRYSRFLYYANYGDDIIRCENMEVWKHEIENCPRRCTTQAISATSENMRDINP
mgnify:CR=1 FL=1